MKRKSEVLDFGGEKIAHRKNGGLSKMNGIEP